MRLLENGATRLLENGASRLLEGETAVVVTTEGNSYTVPRGAGRPRRRLRGRVRYEYRLLYRVVVLEDRADGWWPYFETVHVRATTSESYTPRLNATVYFRRTTRTHAGATEKVLVSLDRAAMRAHMRAPFAAIVNLGARQESSG